MKFDLQPTLKDNIVELVPLKAENFDSLYAVASDHLIWEQHPNKNRYQKEVFENFFEGAINSGSAFLVYENATGQVIGSSRYYELDEENSSVAVGYTFIGRDYWGKEHNRSMKKLMFNHAFQYINKVILHIGSTNFRSQKATEKLGAKKIGEMEIAYYGEPLKLNFVYQVDKQDWTPKN